MKRHIVFLALLGMFCLAASAQAQGAKKTQEKKEVVTEEKVASTSAVSALSVTTETKYEPVVKYDPARDADKDIQEALAEAKATNKRVLLEVGGLWCIWCTHLDDFFQKQQDVLALREKFYVTLKINFSEENKNVDVISRYGKIDGYPHIFVLEADGTLLHSQDTGVLEEGKSYNVDKFMAFLKEWAVN